MADVCFIVLGSLCLLVGFAGCVVPAIPGPLVAYLALFAALGCGDHTRPGVAELVVTGLLTALVTAFDVIVPAIGAKRFSCTRAGTIGCMIGTVVGIFYAAGGGIVLGPFLGALAGELIAGRPFKAALKGAFGALLGFLAGVTMKLLCCVVLAVWFLVAVLGL